jgi:hypothetical protein
MLVVHCEDAEYDATTVEALRITIFSCNVLETVIDFSVGVIFLKLVIYYVKRIKESRLVETGLPLTRQNKFFIYLTAFLMFLNILRSIAPLVYNSYVSSFISVESAWGDPYAVSEVVVLFIIIPVKDFLTIMGLLCLFHHQATRAQRKSASVHESVGT